LTQLANNYRKANWTDLVSGCHPCRSQPTITRFLAGADMRISKAAKIAAHLGLTLKKP